MKMWTPMPIPPMRGPVARARSTQQEQEQSLSFAIGTEEEGRPGERAPPPAVSTAPNGRLFELNHIDNIASDYPEAFVICCYLRNTNA